jgi:hypothetical protein
MWKVMATIIVFIVNPICIESVSAADKMTVTVSGTVEAAKNINLTQKVTLSNRIENCKQIGNVNSVNLGQTSVTLSASGTYYLSVTNGVVSASEVCNGQEANFKIYKTSIEGIGISFNDSDSGSQAKGQPLPIFPQQLAKRAYGSNIALGIGTWVEVRLWKYSSAANTLPYGLLNIQGPTVFQAVGNGAAEIGCNTTSSTSNNGKVCAVNKINPPEVTASVYASTCEFVDAAKTVQMGTHNIPGTAAEGYSSPWVDASFRLRCPNAYGYNSAPNMTALNGTVQVKVVPLTAAINIDKGIIALDGTGAKGVGIQLAWGDYASQSNGTPTKPVKLNTDTAGDTISSNIRMGGYATGSNAITGDGTVNMAARYVRTTGTLEPGPAKAGVIIYANYN